MISISANGANTGATFYQKNNFTVLQDAYAIRWKHKEDVLTDNHYLYLVSSISKTIYGSYEWTNKAGWEKVKYEKIQLPTKYGNIDFKFMEKIIAGIESQRLKKLNKYLIDLGLKDYSLTSAEQKSLNHYESIEFKDLNIVNVFEVKNSGNILSRDIVENSGTTAYLCASADNNAVSSYIYYDSEYLDKGNCVFIGGKTFVVTYQEKDFFSNDSHNLILYLKDEKAKNKLNQLFLATCVHKSLKHKYSWGDSISNRKIQKDIVSLPLKDQELDYEYMETLISAIQKLVIKNVVLYVNEKLKNH
jgi:hypothetical protein